MGKQAKPTELFDLDLDEVSLVDAPAIRRTFVVTKREDGAEDDDDRQTIAAEDDMGKKGEEAGAIKTETTKVEPGDAESTEISKADLLVQIVKEKLQLMMDHLNSLSEGVGTLEKGQVWDLVDKVWNLLWQVEGEVITLSKAVEPEKELTSIIGKRAEATAEKVAVRLPTAQQIAKAIMAVEADMPMSEERVREIVEEVVAKALERVEPIEKAVGEKAPSTDLADLSTKVDGIATILSKLVDETVVGLTGKIGEIEKRVGEAEAVPKGGIDDQTTEIDTQKRERALFDSIIY